jgi:hypothetical protein
MNLVPDRNTRRVAHLMLGTAMRDSGPDAAMRHIRKIPPEQVPALIGLLLTNAKLNKKAGAPRLEDKFTEAERKAGYAAYKRHGDRSEWAIECFREYQRHQQRKARIRKLERKGRAS